MADWRGDVNMGTDVQLSAKTILMTATVPDPIQVEKDFDARQPMGRLSTVDDRTPMIVLLLSNGGQFMTGQSVLVDGGCTT